MRVRSHKRYTVSLLLAAFLSVLALCAGAVRAEAEALLVRDYYSLFSEDEVQALDEQCRAFYEKNGLPIFILTADNAAVGGSADSTTVAFIENYASRNFSGDCVGLIINMETRYMYLDVKCDNEETRRRLTDAKQRRIHDVVREALASGDWYGGAQAFIRQTDEEYNYEGGSSREGSGILYYGVCAVLAAAITGIMYAARASKHKEKRIAVSADPYVVGGTIRLTRQADDFVRTYVTRVAKPKESSGGGTSTHTSSGGHTHSGGGSHF